MNLKGNVTDINWKLCSYTLDNTFQVYAGHMLVAGKKMLMPALGTYMAIRGASRYLKNVFLNRETEIVCSRYCTAHMADCKALLEMIKEYELSHADVLDIAKLCAKCRDADPFGTAGNIQLPDGVSYEDVVLQMVPVLFSKDRSRDRLSPFSPSVTLKLPLDFVENLCLRPEQNAMCCQHPWMFQLPISSAGTCLLGYLRSLQGNGFVSLLDNCCGISCSIAAAADAPELYSQQMSACLDHFVFLRNYHFVVETFTNDDGSLRQFEYFCFNINDVNVLDLKRDLNAMTCSSAMSPLNELKIFQLRILRRAAVTINDSEPQCIYHCLLNDKQYLFRLPTLLLSKCPLMNEGNVFNLSTCSDMFVMNLTNRKYDSIVNVGGLGTELEMYTFPLDMQLELIGQEKLEPLISVREAYISRQSDSAQLVSFQGTVTKKQLFDKFESHLPIQQGSNSYFETQGNQMHYIIIKDDIESASDMWAYTYLNNLEQFQMPVGLVPGMRVAVRHVVQKNKHYYAPTVLTHIEPLAYTGPCAEWGVAFQLGDGLRAPKHALCRSFAQLVHFRRLAVYHQCPICKARWRGDECASCGRQTPVVNIVLELFVHDDVGVADVITKEHNVLRQLLDINDAEWFHWLRCFRILDHFQYGQTAFNQSQYDDYDEVFKDDDCDNGAAADISVAALKEALFLRLGLLSYVQIHRFNLKCFKIDIYCKDERGYPIWYCVDMQPTKISHRF